MKHVFTTETRSARRPKRAPAILSAAILCLGRDVLAQGCASCYTTTAAGGTQTIHALRSGILILLIPPVVMFASVIWILWRWRSMREEMESRR